MLGRIKADDHALPSPTMKKLLLPSVIGTLSLFSCSTRDKVEDKLILNTEMPPSSAIEAKVVEKENTNNQQLAHYFETLPENKKLTKATDYIKDSIIILPTDSGRVVFVGNHQIEDNRSQYKFEGENTAINYYVVSGEFWEDEETYLIDRITGKVDTLWTNPIFSPNDSLLISKSMDYGLEGIPNGYQVWRLDATRKWNLVYETDQERWIPLEFKWISADRFIMKKISVENYLKNLPGISKDLEFEEIDVRNYKTRLAKTE